ncbi:RHS repeat-associated core domain-containing protein [bacterium]|nr:RHS repeat-associated core domain-containing protein [bacterium]
MLYKKSLLVNLIITIIMIMTTCSLYGGDFKYHINDHLGSTRVVLNEAGDVIQYFDYYPFGLSSREVISGSDPAKFTFTGKERDDEGGTGWFYFGARYYDPAIGRWLTPDPLASKYPGLSPYNYCGNNPLVNIDTDGQDYFYLYSNNKINGLQHAGILITNHEEGKGGFDLYSKNGVYLDGSPKYDNAINFSTLEDVATKAKSKNSPGYSMGLRFKTTPTQDIAGSREANRLVTEKYHVEVDNCAVFASIVGQKMGIDIKMPFAMICTPWGSIIFVDPTAQYNLARNLPGATSIDFNEMRKNIQDKEKLKKQTSQKGWFDKYDASNGYGEWR